MGAFKYIPQLVNVKGRNRFWLIKVVIKKNCDTWVQIELFPNWRCQGKAIWMNEHLH